ncbi:ester cyclase [Pseudonocardia bannensis]|uniref:SnoaL-like domain-containing protein n=1 Tax=Pseudonocardia bannensis TaxID=630973 RepID=A0A848DPT7_9PSEU|nr:ester cyclase [Pseudonocardia bannensis]NMH94802.1 SnoaL-like domain-containing protein [Pseudonocardia bannensis]
MNAQRTDTRPENDVVALLIRQHQLIRELCDEVAAAPPAGRGDPFQRLVRLMAVHEAVEEEIVHPYVRRRVAGAAAVVKDRLEEERDAKQILVKLDSLGPESPEFIPLFQRFRESVIAHAESEERSEFTELREQARPSLRRAMAAAAKVATALAPTHPHPGVESASRNILVGTPLAMIDRARDLVREALPPRAAALLNGTDQRATTDSGAANKQIVGRLNEAFDRADEPAMRELLAAGFVAHGMPSGVPANADGWVQLARQVKAGLPDQVTTIDDMLAEGDRVATRFTSRGTHTGELFGMRPSNRTVTVTGLELYRLEDGKIAECWAQLDLSELLGPPGPGI